MLDLQLDALVGGFPCQDYSVARLAHQTNGLSRKGDFVVGHLRLPASK